MHLTPNYPVRWLACLWALVSTMALSGGLLAAEGNESTTETLLFLRTSTPTWVRLTVLLDNQELRASRRAQLQKIFSLADTNGDQKIDDAERTANPNALRPLGVMENWTQLLATLDTDPQDGFISLPELARFGQQRWGDPVRLAQRNRSVRRSSQAVELFDLLDENQDEILDKAEFSQIGPRLLKLDADGDDAFSVIEVEPFRNPFSPRVRTMNQPPEDAPWALGPSLPEALMRRYDQQAPKDLLTAVELGISESQLTAADSNKDGGLSLDELRTWVPTVEPHYTLTVNLPQRKGGQPQLVWTAATVQPARAPSRARMRPVKNLEARIAELPLQLQVSAARASQSDNISFYRLQFLRSDQDKNKYLSPTEFTAMNLPGATFEMVDADRNGEVYEKEVVEFLNLELLADRGHVMLTYDSNEVSLFSLLDLDRDNRLSPRECQSAADAWKSFDQNQDGRLERHELTGKLRLSVELVKPRLFQDVNGLGATMTGDPVITPKTAGPIWFRGMDRNQDGDVSRREFLGSDATFQKWDRNQDGLISVSEAEQQ